MTGLMGAPDETDGETLQAGRNEWNFVVEQGALKDVDETVVKGAGLRDGGCTRRDILAGWDDCSVYPAGAWRAPGFAPDRLRFLALCGRRNVVVQRTDHVPAGARRCLYGIGPA